MKKKEELITKIEGYEHAAYAHMSDVYKKEKNVDDCIITMLSVLPDKKISVQHDDIYVILPDIYPDRVQEVYEVSIDEENRIILHMKSLTDGSAHELNARFCIFDRERLACLSAYNAEIYLTDDKDKPK